MANKRSTATTYEPVDLNQASLGEVRDNYEEKNINTTVRYAWYGSGLLALIIASLGFWYVALGRPHTTKHVLSCLMQCET
jgi:hypothetical protein